MGCVKSLGFSFLMGEVEAMTTVPAPTSEGPCVVR